MIDLKKLRSENGLTQQEVADYLKVSRPTYTKYENGSLELSPDSILALSNLFHVTTDYLLGKKEIKKDVSSDAEYHPTLTERDEKDIQKRLTAILEDIDNQDTVAMYNGGEKMDDATRELMKASLENTIRIAKIKAKEKFTPKKYRK